MLLSHWDEVYGYSISQNMSDLRDMEMDRFVAFLYWYFTRNAASQADVDTFRARLWRPPAGATITPESPWSATNEKAAFNAFANQFSGMAKS